MHHAIHDQPLPPRCPVVYLPGIDGTGRLLYRQPSLAKNYDLHCLSYPQDDRHTYADLVKLGIDQLEASGPGVLVAESFGGAIALMIALERPELVRRMVLISTFAYYPRRLFIDFLAMVGPWFPNEPSPSSSRSIRSFFFFGPGISKADQDAWWDYTVDVPALAYGHRFTLLAALDLRSRLAEIASPALVFAASNDWIVPHPASRLLASKLPRARLIMSNTGHAAMIDPRINIAHWLESAELWDSKKGIGMIPNVPSAHE